MSAPLRVLAYKPRPEPQTIRMERLITCEPLELEYLATVLADHEITLLDGMTDRRDPRRVAREIEPQLVLITAFVTNVDRVVALASALRSLPRPPVVFVGGPHAEVVPQQFFADGIDGVFFADQLRAVARAAARLAAGEPYDDTPGGAFPTADGWVRNDAPPLDPAALPIPARSALAADPDRYFYLYYRRCASLKTAFGCNERCTFCFCTQMHGGRFGPRPLDAVVDEIAGLPTRNVFVVDDNFLTTPARMREFARRLRDLDLAGEREFIVYGTAAFIAAHPDVMRELREVGVTGVIVGFESIDDDELASMHKSARREDNDRTVAICRELDIELFALFIVQPDCDAGAFRRLARYVREQQLAFATFATATPLPGTDPTAPPAPGPGAGGWWRYDLLRLHQAPARMSRLRYYLWLLYLYAVPSLSNAGRRRQLRRYGVRGLLRAGLHSWLVGLEYLVKLWIWR